MCEKSDAMKAIADEIIHTVEDLKFLDGVSVAYLRCDKKKMNKGHPVYGECFKLNEMHREISGYDFMIAVYTPNCEDFTDEQMKILIEHELRHIGVDGEKFYIVPHDIVLGEFAEIERKYGADWCK